MHFRPGIPYNLLNFTTNLELLMTANFVMAIREFMSLMGFPEEGSGLNMLTVFNREEKEEREVFLKSGLGWQIML